MRNRTWKLSPTTSSGRGTFFLLHSLVFRTTAVAAAFLTMFGTMQEFAPESFLQTAPWIFGGQPTELPISIQDCWSIITDTDALPFWFPEVTNVRYTLEPSPDNNGMAVVLGRRVVDFNPINTNLILYLAQLGPIEIDEIIDIWEPDGEDQRRFSFYFVETDRPVFLSFKQVREEFRCDAVTETSSTFTYTVAVAPGLVTALVGFVVKPAFRDIFQRLVPARLLQSVEAGTLPLS